MQAALKVYKSYWLSLCLILFTGGVTWGVGLLWKISKEGSFTALPIDEINAHGLLMIYGWVGLLFMASAYPLLSHFCGITFHRSIPWLVLSFFLAGLALQTLGLLVCKWLFPIGASFHILAVMLFLLFIYLSYRRAQTKLPTKSAGFFLLFGLIAFFFSALFSGIHHWNLLNATHEKSLFAFVATYQAPLRDLQIHGGALFILLGITIAFFPNFYGVNPLSEKKGWIAALLLAFGLITEILFFLLYRLLDLPRMAALLEISWLSLFAGCTLIIHSMRLFRQHKDYFITAAFLWLQLSLILLLVMPLYLMISGHAFSHAYYGAIRHAITVGFVSLMMMGITPNILALFGFRAHLSVVPFLLINLGCFLRVSLQILTDWHPLFFRWLVVSSFVELVGLLCWAIPLTSVLRRHYSSNANQGINLR